MEKIKSILKPGKSTDEHALYGSGQGDNPVIDRLSKDNGQASGLQSSATSPPKAVGTGKDDATTPVDHGKQVDTTKHTPSVSKDTERLDSDRHEASRADANLLATREADRASPGRTESAVAAEETGSAIPRDHPTPVSIPSNASIKSNVVGKVPTGSDLTQEQGDLPRVPATDGKFMNDETLASGVPISHGQGSTIDQSSSLTEETGVSRDATSPHNTVLADRLSPSNEPLAQPGSSIGETGISSQDHHYGRDAAALGAVGAGGVALYGTKQNEDHMGTQNPAASSGLAGATPAGTTTSTNMASTPAHPTTTLTSQAGDEMKLRDMPGAYPETPAVESEKTLGYEASGVGSGAAVIAAQKAYGKSATESARPSKAPTHKIEPSPYNTGVDPRVDAEKRHDNAHAAAGLATAAGVAGAGAYGVSKYQDRDESAMPTRTPAQTTTSTAAVPASGAPVSSTQLDRDQSGSPQGTFGEKIQEAQAHDTQGASPSAIAGTTTASSETKSGPQGTFSEKLQDAQAEDDPHGKNYALAGAAVAATGAGAYGASKYHDREEPVSSQTEVLPSSTEQPISTRLGQDLTTTEQIAGDSRPTESTGARTAEQREFPLAGSHEQAPESKATNFSYPTGVKDTRTPADQPATGQPHREMTSEGRSFPTQAAETGAASAGGAAAYQALRDDEHPSLTHHSNEFDDPLASRAHPKALEGYDDQRAVPSHESHVAGHETVQPRDESRSEHRDAGLLGAGVLGGGAAAGVMAASHGEDEKLEKERLKTAEKKHAEHEKQLEKRQKNEEKARRSEDKARRSEEKHRRKSDEKEHKHGLIHRILHRQKSKEDLEKENDSRGSGDRSTSSLERGSPEQSQYREDQKAGVLGGTPYDDQREYSPVEQAGDSSPMDSGSGTPEKHGRNRLHKDPPPGYVPKHS